MFFKLKAAAEPVIDNKNLKRFAALPVFCYLCTA